MQPQPVKSPISFADLEKLDVRVGVRITEVRRTERENPGALAGRQALFVVNLPPKTMAGMVSEGMLFDIGYADGVTPVLAVPEAPVPPGCRAG